MTSWFRSVCLRKRLIAAAANIAFTLHQDFWIPVTFFFPFSQSNQSAGWRRWVLQITVNCGVNPRGRVLDCPPLPPFLAGPLVSQSWALQPCQPVRQTHQTCRQTLQRASSVLDVLRYVEQVAAVQNKRPAQWSESMFRKRPTPRRYYNNCFL